ncbi:SNF2 family N-terminal domain-containing protein [Daldinia decipiens]|uniref:SNF2 family N-terminal domain-containing protein n=1 Tax=Daldinia decipiens TaxID=326647 RepID=UPI0020C4DA9F|nr:SNF2 family N-terminal domain-containing protein [Daldinia decipiens]KAI1660707.1 SNF2 family N-terminal domain-containing protein [Daldinia decipiens]
MPPLSLHAESRSNRQSVRPERQLSTSVARATDNAGPDLFDQENHQPTLNKQTAVDQPRQAGEARISETTQLEQRANRDVESVEETIRQERLRRQPQEQPRQTQSQGREKRKKMNQARSFGDSLPVAANAFRTAREMYQESESSASALDQGQSYYPCELEGGPLNLAAIVRGLGSYSDDDYDDDSDDGVRHGRNTYPQPAKSGELQEKEIQNFLTMPEIDISPEQRKSTPASMSCTLMEHQKVCLTWLIQQEEDIHKKGGILADTMGLGKTVQALALILARPSKDRIHKTTLIIAPLSLLKQWEREIQTKVKPAHKLKTVILHGQMKRGMTVPRLLTYDVVLTTYGTIISEYKSLSSMKKKPLILANNVIFHRIILDEAHSIKNRQAKASVAVSRIKSTYRLCMTGTPFMNKAEEIFPLIRFLRIKPYSEWDAFNKEINRPLKSWNDNLHDSALRKLQALFRSITLRRTKTSMLDGKPILQLPALVKEEATTKFNKDQQDFYDALEQKQRLKVNEFIKAGTIMRQYSYILVLLLRLRQACCHPHLIKDFGIPEGIQLSSEEMRRLALRLKPNVVRRLKAQTEFECPLCNEATENPLIIYSCGHSICSTCFSAMMEIRDPNSEQQNICPHENCDSEINPERIICHFSFVEAHTPEKLGLDDSDDSDDDSDGFESVEDSDDDVDARGNLKGFIVSGDEDEEEDEEDEEVEEEEEQKEKEDSSDVGDDSTSQKAKPIQPEVSTDAIWKDVSANKEFLNENPAEDSDDDSLMSLEKIWKQVEAMKYTGKDKSEQSKKRKAPSDSVSDVGADVKKASQTGGKRKRPNHENVARSKKRKTNTNSAVSRKRHRNGKTKFTSMAALKKASSSNAAAKAKYLKRLRKDWVPSAKITKTMEILSAIREKDPKEKTLIFSLWTSFLDLLEIPMHDQGFNYTRYDGTMHHDDRDAAAKKFMNDPEVQIMLVSLSAGNAGLNLTAATQVIILEPFWNPFVEEQAVDRAHRIGQKKEVTVHRVLIDGTVEDRIRELQEKKRRLVNAALSEEGARGVGRLSLSELRGLFGLR